MSRRHFGATCRASSSSSATALCVASTSSPASAAMCGQRRMRGKGARWRRVQLSLQCRVHLRGRVLLVDNYDSYTYNLAHLIASVHGRSPVVVRNDEVSYDEVAAAARDGSLGCVVLSPGPGTPTRPDDVGVCRDLLERGSRIPILGVCLGHQTLASVHGCTVRRAREPWHGRRSKLLSERGPLFEGVTRGAEVVRYHSLEVVSSSSAHGDGCSSGVIVTAWADDGEDGLPETGTVMAIAHREFPHHGVQFHPESVATQGGAQLMSNFLSIAERHWTDAGNAIRARDTVPKQYDCFVRGVSALGSVCDARNTIGDRSAAECQAAAAGADSGRIRMRIEKMEGVLRVPGRSSESVFWEGIAPDDPSSCFWLDSASSDIPLPTAPAAPSRVNGSAVTTGIASSGKTASSRTKDGGRRPRVSEAVYRGSLERDGGPARSRFSYMGSRGGDMWRRVSFKLDPPRSGNGRNTDSRYGRSGASGGGGHGVLSIEDRCGVTQRRGGCLFDFLEAELRRLEDSLMPATTSSLPFDFWGGYVGYLGYELKAACDGDNTHASPLPDAVFYLADRFAVVDHDDGSVYLVSLSTDTAGEVANGDWTRLVRGRIEAIDWRNGGGVVTGDAAPSLECRREDRDCEDGLDCGEARSDVFDARHSEDEYLRDIHACQEAIVDGESYELCLTNEMTTQMGETSARRRAWVPPPTYYRALRRINPAPYSAYFTSAVATHKPLTTRTTTTTTQPAAPTLLSVCCSSPEQFLRLHRDGTLEAKPIKGTVRRESDPELDARARARLRSSSKEYAENLMIVDLLRNDLARVSKIGSVAVPKLMDVETYANVHQLVSTVTATRARGKSAVRCVQAAFPGGSMTGAPKIRSMRILDAIEGGPRGVYSGSLGFFSANGTVDLNIVIRTAVFEEECDVVKDVFDAPARGPIKTTVRSGGKCSVSIGAGGAITHLSDAQAELDEVMLKAEPLLAAARPRRRGNCVTAHDEALGTAVAEQAI